MAPAIRTPDQRLRVFVSSTLEELAVEREAVRDAIEALRLTPVMFELGARPHPPADVYRAYLEQSDVFVGIYGERYGWIGPGMEISGLEDEYRRSAGKPRLMYVKRPASGRDPRLSSLIEDVQKDAAISYKAFETPAELRELLQQDIAVLLTEQFAAVSTGAVPLRTNIPAPVDGFLGRGDELHLIADLLDHGTRLITVVGPGGVGKTRLALEVSRRSMRRFREGSAFVALDAVVDPALVAPVIAASLGLRSDPSAAPLDALAEQLGDRQLLLVLDNFEQVLDAASDVADLLARCAEVSVLATSRSPLRLRGEQELHIEPLAVPDPATSPAAIAGAASVQLFAHRARQLEPTFGVTEDNAPEVAELCKRLDGLPLALELAAARIRLFTPAEMLNRLAAGIDFLAGGPRDAPRRQRGLRAAIGWSFDLLDEGEREALMHASVFRGGWDLSAVEAIAGRDAADRLRSLLEHSLIKRVLTSGTARFDMLEAIRVYAAEQLQRNGKSSDVQNAHARHYLELVAAVTPALHDTGQVGALERVEAENENLRAAIGWSLRTGHADAVAAIAPGLMHFWWLRGDIDEGLRWIDAVLGASTLTSAGRARALLTRGFLTFWRAPLEADVGAFEEAAEIFAAVDDVPRAALSKVPLAVYRAIGGDSTALEQLETSERVLAESGDQWGALLATNAQCWTLNLLDAEAPLTVFEDAVARAAAAGVEAELATALGNLGRRQVRDGELDHATQSVLKALRIVRRLRSKTGSAYYLSLLADIAARRGESGVAIRLFAAADASGQPTAGMLAPERQRTVAAARAELGDPEVDALERAGAALELGAAVDEALSWGSQLTAA